MIDCTLFERLAGSRGAALTISDIYFALSVSGSLFTFRKYPPFDLLESWGSRHTTTKIFESKGVTCKIFRTKELATSAIISGLMLQLQD